MTTIDQARTAVYDRFIALFPAAAPGVPYTFENEAFEQPEGQPWVRLSVRNVQREQECLGPPGHRRFQTNAITFGQVFIPGDTGTKDSGSLAAVLQSIFEGVSFDGLDFRAVTPREVGVDNGWHQTLVEAPFDYEETK